jgi:hypothetical protein
MSSKSISTSVGTGIGVVYAVAEFGTGIVAAAVINTGIGADVADVATIGTGIGAVAVADSGIGAVVGPSSSLNKAAAARNNSCGLCRTGVVSGVTVVVRRRRGATLCHPSSSLLSSLLLLLLIYGDAGVDAVAAAVAAAVAVCCCGADGVQCAVAPVSVLQWMLVPREK